MDTGIIFSKDSSTLFPTCVDDVNQKIFINLNDSDLRNVFNTNTYGYSIYKDENFWSKRINSLCGFTPSELDTDEKIPSELYVILQFNGWCLDKL